MAGLLVYEEFQAPITVDEQNQRLTPHFLTLNTLKQNYCMCFIQLVHGQTFSYELIRTFG